PLFVSFAANCSVTLVAKCVQSVSVVGSLIALICQLPLVSVSVNATRELRRVASAVAARSPLTIDSDVERISLLRMNVVNDGIPSRKSSARIASAAINSIKVNPRELMAGMSRAIAILAAHPADSRRGPPRRHGGGLLYVRLVDGEHEAEAGGAD